MDLLSHVMGFALLSSIAAGVREAPKSYDCYRAKTPIHVDGKLDDAAWQKAPWTPYFVDIEGASKPVPRFRTRAKMLWDDEYLYFGAELRSLP